jgi:hypothetical protein
MKSKFLLAALAITTVFVAPSCGKKGGGSTGLLVPDDAVMVFHINSKSLGSKLSREEIRQTNWFREMSTQVSDSNAKKLFDDPSITGVDTDADFVVFLKKQGRSAYIAFEGSVKDAAKFGAFVKEHMKEGVEAKKGEFTSYTFSQKETTGGLTWNKTNFVLMASFAMPDMGNAGMYGKRRFDDEDKMQGSQALPIDSVIYYSTELLSLSKSKLLDKDDRFASLVKDGKDMHFWFNTEQYMRSMIGPSMITQLGNVSALFEGNASAMSANFDNGKITVDSKQFYGSKMSSLISKNQGKDIDDDLLGRIPSENVLGVLAINFKPDLIKDILDLTKLSSYADMALKQMELNNVESVLKAFKGEMLLAATDFSISHKVDSIERFDGTFYTDSSTKPSVKWIFATSVNDKDAFAKLIHTFDKGGDLQSNGSVSHKMDNNWFTIGSSDDFINQFLAGGKTKPAYADKIKGHPMGLYLDLQKIWPAAMMDAKDSSARAAIDVSSKMWQDIVGYGGEFKDKALVFHAEINLVDKNTNSLKQLNAYLDTIYKIAKPQMDKWKNKDIVMDEEGIEPPPPPVEKIEVNPK